MGIATKVVRISRTTFVLYINEEYFIKPTREIMLASKKL